MQLIDKGALECEDLLLCLKQHFGNPIYREEIEPSIASVSNHKGHWSIGFVGVPPVKTVLALLSLMNSEMLPICADYLHRVVFNEGAVNERVFDFAHTQDLFSQKHTCLALLDGSDWS